MPTTEAGLERVFSLFVAGVRLGTVAQMAPALHAGVLESQRPALYLACWAAAAVAAVAVTVGSLVLRRPLGTAVAVADFALACLLLALGPFVLPPDVRFGAWSAFQPGYALSVIITASGVRSVAVWLGGLGAVVAAYVVYLGGPGQRVLEPDALGNVLTFVVYAIVSRTFFRYTRRIARDADASRARAAELARREEERRAQVLMHNGVAVMRLLTEPGLDDAARSRLIDQAEVELRGMRAYLASPPEARAPLAHDEPGAEGAERVRLVDTVRRTCERFADLPVEPALDLGAGVEVPTAVAEAVGRGLDSLLLNVREHARADLVVVHLDADDDGRWALTVSDDGIGFDPGATPRGVGLREVVLGELERLGLGVEVLSAPAEGTTVTVTASASASASAPAVARGRRGSP
ncbi:ATP-binding protein [Cellulosimicrobium sp. PMB13]|uniref:ATP-binding protein n=1 Tax=Cellulosimicrobium sp. PMB13 TaxID=3120158 RepID=UPI003F4C08C6